VNRIAIALSIGAAFGCSDGTAEQAAQLRANIGKSACNQVNGAYRGRIVDVTLYAAAGQSAELVYVVERDGRRQNAPVSNTTVAERCADGPAAPAQAPSANAPPTATPAPDVGSGFEAVATEFSRRLRAYQGTLSILKPSAGVLRVSWTSQRCDMTEGEVIDLLLSINRGHREPLRESIEAERTCSGATRRFSASASRFEQYRSGQINDPAILEGLK